MPVTEGAVRIKLFSLGKRLDSLPEQSEIGIPDVRRLADDRREILQKPPVDLRELEDLLDAPPALQRQPEKEDPLRIRHRQLRAQRVVIDHLVRAVADEPKALDLQTPQRLLQRLLE